MSHLEYFIYLYYNKIITADEVLNVDLLAEIRRLSECGDFTESKNYYFETHRCPKKQEDVKVYMDYTFSSDIGDDILRIGICPYCGKCYYHRDFASKGL